MKPLVKNAADEKQVKAAQNAVNDLRKQELEDLKFILQTPQGRRFVWRYLGVCGVFEISFTGNSETFFKEGKRNVGLMLLSDVNEAHPEAYLEMLKESKEQEILGEV